MITLVLALQHSIEQRHVIMSDLVDDDNQHSDFVAQAAPLELRCFSQNN